MNPQEIMLLMQDPTGYVLSKGFKLPPNTQFKSPKDIVQYLMQSGQVNQESYNQGYQMAQQMGYKV